MIAPIYCRLSDSKYCALMDAVYSFYSRLSRSEINAMCAGVAPASLTRAEHAVLAAYCKGIAVEECFELLKAAVS